MSNIPEDTLCRVSLESGASSLWCIRHDSSWPDGESKCDRARFAANVGSAKALSAEENQAITDGINRAEAAQLEPLQGTKATNRDILAELNDWALYGSNEYPQEPIPKSLSTRAMNEIKRLRAIETRAKEAQDQYGLLHAAEAIDYILNGDSDAE